MGLRELKGENEIWLQSRRPKWAGRGMLPQTVKEIVVHSLGELVNLATPNEPDQASGRLRDTSVYRGMSDASARLLTSLDRLGGSERPHAKAELEAHLLRNFLRYGRPFLDAKQERFWEVMVVAEHHGLPTRLLDWTHSPIVAAHFATLASAPENDRIIWRLDWKKVHERFGLRPFAFLVEDLDEVLLKRGFQDGWDFLDAKIATKEHFACLLDPPAVTGRIAVQSGAFTLCSAKDRALDEVLGEAGIGDALTRFVIPKERAGYMRDQLDLCTVDERRLFPGLDGIAAELRRYYSSSGPGRHLETGLGRD